MKKLIIFISIMTIIAVPVMAQEYMVNNIGFKSEFTVVPEIYNYKYVEPGLMEDVGTYYGLKFLDKRYHNEILDRSEIRFAFGYVKYRGGLWDGTDHDVDHINNIVWELRWTRGFILPENNNTVNIPYFGIGYRNLIDNNHASDDFGYRRESKYLYIPVGHDIIFPFGNDSAAVFSIELDIFLLGTQYSYFVESDPMINNQGSGYGFRTSYKINNFKATKPYDLEVFLRYWNIEESDRVTIFEFYEPKNNTTEWGFSVYWM